LPADSHRARPASSLIKVQSASGPYSVSVGAGLLSRAGTHPLLRDRPCFLVTSPHILGLHGEALLKSFPRAQRPVVLLVPPGERYKSLATIERLATELARAGAHRDAMLIPLGGGVITDLTGFLAAIYQRGVDYISLPTTLLAQVDAAIGGKTGVNLSEGKNLLGSIHPPRAVLADTTTLATLSPREFRAGLFECIKCALIRDPALLSLLTRHRESILAPASHRDPKLLERVILASIRVKASIVARDEHESGERMLLNFGHTFAHALESALNYRTLLHGEAVAYGMLAALHLSAICGLLSADQAAEAGSFILSCGPLPRFKLSPEEVIAAMSRDKKHTASSQRFILLSSLGHAHVISGLPPSRIRAAVRAMLATGMKS
jgi:3-dehydroquinate synthase